MNSAIYTPKVGDFLAPDGWVAGGYLEEDDGYSDAEFPGCEFRFSDDYPLAINVKVTGRKFRDPNWIGQRVRVRIEFVRDGGEPSEFLGGWLYPKA